MNLKVTLSVLLNLLALAVPTAGLYAVFGRGTPVESDNPQHLAALLAVMLFAFIAGLIASAVLRSGTAKSAYVETLETIGKTLRDAA